MSILMNEKMKRISVILLTLALVFALPVQAFANYYGMARNSSTGIHGAYFYANIQDLDSKWSTTNNTRFVLHTVWIEDSSGKKWLENGFMDGAIQEPGGTIQYHKGYYTAQGEYSNSSAYKEYKIIGPGTTTGSGHSFHIQRDGTDKWGVYVDFDLKRTYSSWSTSGQYVDVGLETNYTGSTSSEWNERSLQLYNGTTWNNWGSGTLSFTHSTISVSWDTSPTSIKTKKS